MQGHKHTQRQSIYACTVYMHCIYLMQKSTWNCPLKGLSAHTVYNEQTHTVGEVGGEP